MTTALALRLLDLDTVTGVFGERVGGVEVWGHPGSYGELDCSLLVVPARGAVFAGLISNADGVRETVHVRVEERERLAGVYENTTERYEVAMAGDGLCGTAAGQQVVVRPIREALFEADGWRIDFPLEGFGRFGSRLAERVA
jgi:hypothetical protein